MVESLKCQYLANKTFMRTGRANTYNILDCSLSDISFRFAFFHDYEIEKKNFLITLWPH